MTVKSTKNKQATRSNRLAKRLRAREERRFASSLMRSPITTAVSGIMMAMGGAQAAYAASAADATVVYGDTTFANPTENHLQVLQNSTKTVINWTQFGIRANEHVQYVQPGSDAVALNRVIGGNPSEILGQLTSNGQVFLLNQNGVLFGEGAQVNVGGLVASTLDISDEDFINGDYNFSLNGGTGTVLNYGDLNASGYVALLGNQVSNEGVITAKSTVLASGDQIRLSFQGEDLIDVTVDAATMNALVENKGAIIADDGQVIMTAAAADEVMRTIVNNEGVIEAKGIVNDGGKILLLAEGGHAEMSGSLNASAETDGDGGDARVLAFDGVAHFTGSIEARGGDNSGNGGFTEVSGKKVGIYGSVDTRAPNGENGEFLIDPADITIVAGAGNNLEDQGGGLFSEDTDGTSTIGADAIETLLGTGDVTISTAGGAGVAPSGEDITVAVGGAISVDTNNSLTLLAGEDILLLDSIDLDSGADGGTSTLNLTAGQRGDITTGGVIQGAGTIRANTVDVDADSVITLSGGITAPILNLNINETGPISVADWAGGTVNADTANGSITIEATTGNIIATATTASGTVTITSTAGNVDLTEVDADDLIVNATSAGATITDGATGIDVTGTTTLNGVTDGDITLDNVANDFGTVVVNTANDVTITDATAISVGPMSSVSGNLVVTTVTGGITDSGTLSITGNATFTATDDSDIVLDEANNNIGGTVSADGGAFTYTSNLDVTLGTVSATGDVDVNVDGDITTTNGQTVTGATIDFINTDAAGTVNIVAGSNVNSTANGNHRYITDNFTLAGNLNAGTGDVNVTPFTVTNTIEICDGGLASCTTTLDTEYDINSLTGLVTAGSFTFGRSTHTGNITLEAITIGDYDVNVVNGGAGSITVDGAYDATTGENDLSLDSGSGGITLNASIDLFGMGTPGTFTAADAVTLGADITVDGSADFQAAIDADMAGNERALIITNAATATFAGAVGTNQALADLDVTATTINLNTSSLTINADGAGETVTFTGATVLGADTVTITTDGTNDNNISFAGAGTVDADDAAAQNRALVILAGTGTVVFAGNIGASESLADFDVTATGGITFNGGTLRVDDSSGATATITGAVTLGTTLSVDTNDGAGGGDNNITFVNDINSSTAAEGLTVDGGDNGNVTFSGNLGNGAGTELDSLTVDGGVVTVSGTVETDDGGAINFGGTAITTLNLDGGSILSHDGAGGEAGGTIDIDATNVTLGADLTVASNDGGGTGAVITISSTNNITGDNGDGGDAYDFGITIDSGDAATDISGATFVNLDHFILTASTATLGDITTGDGDGAGGVGVSATTTVGNLILTGAIDTTGETTTAGTVTLSATGNIVVNGTASVTTDAGTTDAAITLNDAVEGNAAGADDLTLTSGDATITIGGAIGATNQLDDFEANASGGTVDVNANIRADDINLIGSTVDLAAVTLTATGVTGSSQGDILVRADTITDAGVTFAGDAGDQTVTFGVVTAARAIDVGDAGAGTRVTETTLGAADAATIETIIVGESGHTGDVNFVDAGDDAFTLSNAGLTINADGATGDVAIDSSITLAGQDDALLINGDGATTTLTADITTTGGDVTINDALVITGDRTIATNGGATTTAGNITIATPGTIDGDGAGTGDDSLVLDADDDTDGDISVAGAVGGTDALYDFTATGAQIDLNNVTVDGTNNDADIAITGSNIDLNGTTYQIQNGAGGNETISFTGAVDLHNNVTVTGANTAATDTITFSTTINADDESTQDRSLSVLGGAGNVTLSGAAGTTDSIEGGVTITGATVSTAAIDTASAEATEAGGAVMITVSNGLTVSGLIDTRGNTTGGGGQVDVVSTGGTTSLNDINASGGGTTDTGGAVNIDTAGGGGTITLNGDITTTGATTGGNVTIGNTILLNGAAGDVRSIDTGSAGGNIDFGANTIDGSEGLSLTAGTGDINQEGAVGGTTALNAYTVVSADEVDSDSIRTQDIDGSDADVEINATTLLLADNINTDGGANAGDVDINVTTMTLDTANVTIDTDAATTDGDVLLDGTTTINSNAAFTFGMTITAGAGTATLHNGTTGATVTNLEYVQITAATANLGSITTDDGDAAPVAGDAIDVTATTINLYGDLTTTSTAGANNNGDVELNGNVVVNSGDRVIDTSAATVGDVLVTGTVTDAGAMAPYALDIDAGTTGDVDLQDDVTIGRLDVRRAVNVTLDDVASDGSGAAGGIDIGSTAQVTLLTLNGTSYTTTNTDISFDAVRTDLESAGTLNISTDTGAGNITVTGTIEDAAADEGDTDLDLDSGTGNIDLQGNVGGTNGVNTFTADSTNGTIDVANIIADGAIDIDAGTTGRIDLNGSLYQNDNGLIIFRSDVDLNDGTGTTTINSPLDSVVFERNITDTTNTDLVVNAGGSITFNNTTGTTDLDAGGDITATIDTNTAGTDTLTVNGDMSANEITLQSTAGDSADDTIQVNANITTDDGDLLIQEAGTAVLNATAGDITLTSNGVTNPGDLTISTTATVLDGTNTVFLDANGMGAAGDADVSVTAVTTNGTDGTNLTITADGGATFASFDLDDAPDGDLSITVDADMDTAETLTINGGITNVAMLTLSGGATTADDVININAAISTSGDIIIQNANDVNVEEVTIQTSNGDITGTTNIGTFDLIGNANGVTTFTTTGGTGVIALDGFANSNATTDLVITSTGATTDGDITVTENIGGGVGYVQINAAGATGDVQVEGITADAANGGIGIDIDATNTVDNNGTLLTNNGTGEDIDIDAGTGVTLDGALDSDDQIFVTATTGNVAINNNLTADDDIDVSADAGSVTQATGNNMLAGGDVFIDGQTGVTISGSIGATTEIVGTVQINQTVGQNGTVTFQTTGDVFADGNILVSGASINATAGQLNSSSGGVSLDASGNITTNTIVASANTVNGNTDAVKIDTATGNVTTNGTITATAAADLNIDIDPTDVLINNNITATGQIDITALNDIDINAFTVRADSDGMGGGTLNITADDANDADGAGDLTAVDGSTLRGAVVNLDGFNVTTDVVTADTGDATITANNEITLNDTTTATATQVVVTAAADDVNINGLIDAGTNVDIDANAGSVLQGAFDILAGGNVNIDGGAGGTVDLDGTIGNGTDIGGNILIGQTRNTASIDAAGRWDADGYVDADGTSIAVADIDADGSNGADGINLNATTTTVTLNGDLTTTDNDNTGNIVVSAATSISDGGVARTLDSDDDIDLNAGTGISFVAGTSLLADDDIFVDGGGAAGVNTVTLGILTSGQDGGAGDILIGGTDADPSVNVQGAMDAMGGNIEINGFNITTGSTADADVAGGTDATSGIDLNAANDITVGGVMTTTNNGTALDINLSAGNEITINSKLDSDDDIIASATANDVNINAELEADNDVDIDAVAGSVIQGAFNILAAGDVFIDGGMGGIVDLNGTIGATTQIGGNIIIGGTRNTASIDAEGLWDATGYVDADGTSVAVNAITADGDNGGVGINLDANTTSVELGGNLLTTDGNDVGDIVVTANTSIADTGAISVDSDNDIDLNAGTGISLNTATSLLADNDIFVDGGIAGGAAGADTVTLGILTSGQDGGAGDILIGRTDNDPNVVMNGVATATGGFIEVNGNDVTINAAASADNGTGNGNIGIEVDAQNDIITGAAGTLTTTNNGTGDNVNLDAGNEVTVGAKIDSDENIVINATADDVNINAELEADGSIDIDAVAGSVIQAATFNMLAAANVNIDGATTVDLNGTIGATTAIGGNISINTARNGSVTIDGNQTADGRISIGQLGVSGSVTIDSAAALQSDNNNTAAGVNTGEDVIILSGSSIAQNTGTIDSNLGGVRIATDGGTILVTNANSDATVGGFAEVTTAGAADADGRTTIQVDGSGDVTVGGVDATAGGDSDVEVRTESNIVLNDITADDTVYLEATDTGANQTITDNNGAANNITATELDARADLYIGRVANQEVFLDPEDMGYAAGNGDAIETAVSNLTAITTDLDGEISIDNTIDGLLTVDNVIPSVGVTAHMYVRNDQGITVNTWTIDANDDVGLIAGFGDNVGDLTVPNQAINVGRDGTGGTIRFEAATNGQDVLFAGGNNLDDITALNFILKSGTSEVLGNDAGAGLATAMQMDVANADIQINGAGNTLMFTQDSGANDARDAHDLSFVDLDMDGYSLTTQSGNVGTVVGTAPNLTATHPTGITQRHSNSDITYNDEIDLNLGNLGNGADLVSTVLATGAASTHNPGGGRASTDASDDEGGNFIATGTVLSTDSNDTSNTGTLIVEGRFQDDSGNTTITADDAAIFAAPSADIVFIGDTTSAGNVTLIPGTGYDVIFDPDATLNVVSDGLGTGTLTIEQADEVVLRSNAGAMPATINVDGSFRIRDTFGVTMQENTTINVGLNNTQSGGDSFIASDDIGSFNMLDGATINAPGYVEILTDSTQVRMEAEADGVETDGTGVPLAAGLMTVENINFDTDGDGAIYLVDTFGDPVLVLGAARLSLDTTGGMGTENLVLNGVIDSGGNALVTGYVGAEGSITSGGGAQTFSDFGNLVFDAVNGIGTSGSPILTQVLNVAARNTTAGGIFITEDGGTGLEIETLSAFDASGGTVNLTGILNSGTDDVIIQANTPLTVNATVVDNAGNNITLSANGTTAADDLIINADVTASGGNGNISLFAGDTITVNGGRTISAAGAGDVTIRSGFDFATMADTALADSDVDLAATSAVTSGTGTITVTAGNDAFISSLATGGNASILAGQTAATGEIADSNGTGTNVTAVQLTTSSEGDTELDTDVTTLLVSTTTGGDVEIRENDGVDLGTSSVSGDYELTAGGAVTNTAGALTITGFMDVNASGFDITLDFATNDFSSDAGGTMNSDEVGVSADGVNVTIVDDNAVTLGDITATGDLMVTTTGGDINNTLDGQLAITGTATFDAGTDDIMLGNLANDNANFGDFVVTGAGDVTVRESSQGDITSVTNTANLDYRSGGRLLVTLVNVATDATLRSANGNVIIGDGGVTAGGTATITSDLRSIRDLNNDGGVDIDAAVTVLTAFEGIGTNDNGNDIELELDTETLTATTTTGRISLDNTPDGTVTINGLNTGGPSTLTDTSNDITYKQTGQNLIIAGAISSSGGNILIDPPVDVAINANVTTTGAGTITIQGTGDITQANGTTVSTDTGALLIAGGTTATEALSFTMADDSTLSSTTGTITVRANAITLDNVTTNGNVVLDADAATGNVITQTTGTAGKITASDVNVSVAATDNIVIATDVETITTAAGDTVTITEDDDITLTDITTDNGAAVMVTAGNEVVVVNVDTDTGASPASNGTVSLTSTNGSVTNNDGATVDVVTGALTVVADNDIDLDTDVTSVNFTATNGTVNINEVAAGVSITATGTAAGTVNVDTAGANATLTANSISGQGVALNAMGATSDVMVSGAVNAGAGVLDIDATQNITTGAAGTLTTTANADLDAGNNITIGGNVTANGVTLDAAAGNIAMNAAIAAGNGDLVGNAGTGITSSAAGVLTSNQNIQLDAMGGAIDLDGTVTATGTGVITLTADTSVTTDAAIDATDGAVTMTAEGGDVDVNSSVDGEGVTLTSDTANVTVDGAVDAGGSALTILADVGITTGAGGTLATTDSIDLDATTGAIVIGGAVTATGAGSIDMDAGTSVTIDAAVDADLGPVTITAMGGDVDVNSTVSGEGVTLDSDTANVTIDDAVNAGTSTLRVIAEGSITTGAGGTLDTTDANIDLDATGSISLGDTVTSTDAGDITIDAGTSVTINTDADVDAGTGMVTITAMGGDVDVDATVTGEGVTIDSDTANVTIDEAVDAGASTLRVIAENSITTATNGTLDTTANIDLDARTGAIMIGASVEANGVGSIDMDAGTSITIDAPVDAFTGAVTMTANNGSVTINDEVDGDTVMMTAIEAAEGTTSNVDINDNVTAANGITLVADDNITIDNATVAAGAGVLSADADMDITSNSAGILTSNNNIILDAGTNAGDGDIDLDGTVTATGAGFVMMSATDDVTLSAAVNSGTGAIDIDANSDVTTDGTGTLTAGTTIDIDAANDSVTLGAAVMAGDDITINANDNIQQQGTGTITTMTDVTMTATTGSINPANNNLLITADNLVASAVAGSITVDTEVNTAMGTAQTGIDIDETSSIEIIDTLNTGTGVITVVADGNITTTADMLTNSIENDGGAITLTAAANNGDITVNGPIDAAGTDADITLDADGAAFINASITSDDDDISITADEGITHGPAGDVTTAGTGTVTETTTDAGTDIVMEDGSVITTAGGMITLTATQSVALSQVNATSAGDVTVTAGTGNVTDNTAAEDFNVKADVFTVTAATGIGSDTPVDADIDTMVNSLSAATTSGGIFIGNTGSVNGDFTIVGATAGAGDITITTDEDLFIDDGMMAINNNAIDADAGNVTLTAGDSVVANDGIESSATITVTAQGMTGTNGLMLGNVEMADGVSFVGNRIVIDADGSAEISLLSSASDVIVVAGDSIFSSDTDATTPNILATTAVTLVAETGTVGQLGRAISIEHTNQTMPGTLQGPQVNAYAGSTATNGTTREDASVIGTFPDVLISINLFGNALGHEVNPIPNGFNAVMGNETVGRQFEEEISPGLVLLNATNPGIFPATGSGARVVGGQLYDDYRIATAGSINSVLDFTPLSLIPVFEGTSSGAYPTDRNRLAPFFDIEETELWTIEDDEKTASWTNGVNATLKVSKR